jgi:hypothetical protein
LVFRVTGSVRPGFAASSLEEIERFQLHEKKFYPISLHSIDKNLMLLKDMFQCSRLSHIVCQVIGAIKPLEAIEASPGNDIPTS